VSATFHFTVDCDWIPNTERNLPRIFELIEKFGIEPTFFITGKFAEDYGDYVLEMKRRNWEIGSHGLKHGLDPEENFSERVSYDKQWRLLSDSTGIIEKVTGMMPVIFRAPRLKISDHTFKILTELKYKIDSSIPVRRFDFGFGSISNTKHLNKGNSSFYINDSLLEIPPSALFFPMNMRLVRLIGAMATANLISLIKRSSDVVVFYVHPLEFLKSSDLNYVPIDCKQYLKSCGPQNFGLLEEFLGKVMDGGMKTTKMMDHLDRNEGGKMRFEDQC
jgi:hypothetical protein